MGNKAEMNAYKALIDYRNARVNGGDGLVESQVFHNQISFVNDFDRKSELQQMFTAMNFAQAGKIFEAFGKAAKQFSELKDGFELSKKMADSGKEDLFFPSAAAELSTVASTVKVIKEATDSIIQKTNVLDQAYEKSDAQVLIDEAKQAKEDINKLIDALDELKNALPN